MIQTQDFKKYCLLCVNAMMDIITTTFDETSATFEV